MEVMAEARIRSSPMKWIERFLADDSGATAIEYGLLAALLGVAIVVSTKALGTKLSSTFASVTGNLN